MNRLPLLPALLLSTIACAVAACGSPAEPATPSEVTPATTAPATPTVAVAPAPVPSASPSPVGTGSAKPAAPPVQPDLALLDHTGDLCQGAKPAAPTASATASKVTIKPGEVKVTGSVNSDVTTALLAAGKDQFAACYAASIDAKNEGAKTGGKVGGVFVFGKDGKVALSRIEQGATTADRETATCIVRAICGMTFQPPSSGIVTVAHSMSVSTP